jgi:hypothetical protein
VDSYKAATLSNRDFVESIMDDCIQVARIGGHRAGDGFLVVDRRERDHYLVKYLSIKAVSGFGPQMEQEIAIRALKMTPGYPEMGMVVYVIGESETLLEVYPTTPLQA